MNLAWFNGQFVDGAIALDPNDRALTLGDGLFETMLVANGVALWRNMHLARLEGSSAELGLPFDRAAIDQSLDTVLHYADSLQVLRLTLSRGTVPRGLASNGRHPSLLITLEPFDKAQMFRPATLITSTIRRSPSSPAARLKSLSYLDNIAAAREAASRGYDDALMLNTDGFLASSTIANLFLLKGRELITPARDQAILTGVMRQTVIAHAPQLGLQVKERPVKPVELFTADAAFLTNSLRFLRPMKSFDGSNLSTRDLTPLADALCETARLQCGADPRLL